MRALLTTLLLAAVACGGSSSDDAKSSCRAVCDKQATATGCTNLSQYVSNCKTLCDVVVPQLDSSCRAKAQAAFDCQVELTYQCFEGGSIPVQTTDDCQAELQAYADCLGTQQ